MPALQMLLSRLTSTTTTNNLFYHKTDTINSSYSKHMHYTRCNMQLNPSKQRGFTIVELLIVVVVIAILAAITIVSYNGIQKRAREATLSTNLGSAAQQLKVDLSLTGDGIYPATLAAANSGRGVPTPDNTIYQYTVNNTAIPPTFCITGSTSGIDLMVTESTTPTAGVCPGHTAGGIVKPIITNLAPNPNIELSASGWSGSRIGTVVKVDGGAKEGGSFARSTVNSIGSFPRAGTAPLPATPGTVYTFSAWIRSSASVRASYIFNNGSTVVTPLIVSNNQWVRVSVTSVSAPAGTTTMKGYFGITDDSPIDTTFDIDGAMITTGTGTPAFADGTTPGWAWNGAQHDSTSFGPTP